jgi:phage-related protein
MEFSIEFYETENGKCPVLEFLSELADRNIDTHTIIVEGLKKLEHRYNHREPLSKSIGNGLYELRHVGKLNTRVLWFFMKGRRIIAVHGIRNKAKKIQNDDIEVAIHRKKD